MNEFLKNVFGNEVIYMYVYTLNEYYLIYENQIFFFSLSINNNNKITINNKK